MSLKKIVALENKYAGKIDGRELEIFLAEVIGKDAGYVVAHPEQHLFSRKFRQLQKCINLRQQGYSVAAIIGRKEFYGLDFLVDKNVLIPRPETELLAEEAIKEINKVGNDKIILIDVGTGTGCIPISILKNTDKKIKAFATDISVSALRIAKKNAKKHKVKITFYRGSLLAPLLNKFTNKQISQSTLIITANLPYLTRKQFSIEPSIQKEPKIALVADNKKGLSLYEKLFKQIQKLPLSKSIKIFIEIDPRQKNEAVKLVHKYFPKANFEIKKDLSGRDRLIIIEKLNKAV